MSQLVNQSPTFSSDVLALDPVTVCRKIEECMRAQVFGTFRKRGAVVALSGGIDSSVCAALSVRALGAERVLGVLMPERDSSDDALRLGQLLASRLGITTTVENIQPLLAAAGCYERQDAAIRMVCSDYGPGWRFKLVLPSLLEGDRLNITLLTVMDPAGESRTVRLTPSAYMQLVAATNFKQRSRAMLAYYHADRLNYAVIGTPNRLEYDQGFFVKGGDGLADVKPIAHLYKTQVYAIAEYVGVPEEIRRRPPTTDTFSLPQTQEEFYFALPYDRMDLCLYGYNHSLSATTVAEGVRLSQEQVERIYRDIEAKRRATKYLHMAPVLVEAVSEI
jgi:NAD+ synthase